MKITTYDPAKALDSQEAIDIFLDDAFQTGDAAYIANALGVVARAKGMTNVANDADLSRGQLYRSLSENGNPTLTTIIKVMKSFGLGLKPVHESTEQR
jgi:probable addiction module antidote protein